MNKDIRNCARWVALLALASFRSAAMDLPVVPGPFTGTMESLTNYHCPDWFRDAKFGIWAHWGPQSVPMEGDWYARKMYQQGSDDYNDHLARYGHPSTNGWKDIIPLWKAEKWNPEKLIQLYKRAGARYFVSMGSHHDDFFLWNSPLHKWNSVNYGPHRDVVGDWQRAAKKYGLPFGVSEHLGASFVWFQDSHRSDKTGPLAGVPYDGANSNYWDLYHFPAEKGENEWYSNNPRWQSQWYTEIKELLDNYHPDLLYSDGGVAFGNEVGLSQIANFYNGNIQANDGKLTAVYTCKQPSEGRWVQDFERGVNAGINPYPWQTDTSIGDWFYNRHWKYQPLSWTVHMLVDIVSKNGNLLLNVVLRPDGTLDPEVQTMMEQLADWTTINGEAIYGTRPWQIFGEGPAKVRGGAFKEDYTYTAKDIRFTTKSRTLYAIALGWPKDGKVVIHSLARTDDASANHIERVELIGHKGALKFTQSADGLTAELPGNAISDLTCTLKIAGSNWKAVTPVKPVILIQPDSKGVLQFLAATAELHGSGIQVEERYSVPNIGYWDSGKDWVSWKAHLGKSGAFRIKATMATEYGGSTFVLDFGGGQITGQVPQTGGWGNFQTVDLGQVRLNQPGDFEVKMGAKDPAHWSPMNLSSIELIPAE